LKISLLENISTKLEPNDLDPIKKILTQVNQESSFYTQKTTTRLLHGFTERYTLETQIPENNLDTNSLETIQDGNSFKLMLSIPANLRDLSPV